MKYTKEFKNYTLLSAGNKEKIENWNGVILKRPDPVALWPNKKEYDVDAYYTRNSKGGGEWSFNKRLPEYWTVNYKKLTFKVSPTNFKHTGLFPEQAVNWEYMINKISNANRKISVLNLFAYTGGATMACSYAGASVVHVDSAKGMVEWAKENANLSGLANNDIRYIVDDCLKFVLREYRRGNTYDAIIMDPPSFGRGPSGEVWKFEEKITELIEACINILSDNPLFLTINTYTTGVSTTAIENVLKKTIPDKFKGTISSDEIGIYIEDDDMILPCGNYARFETE